VAARKVNLAKSLRSCVINLSFKVYDLKIDSVQFGLFGHIFLCLAQEYLGDLLL
jgi:hypothetical protein